MEFEEILSSLPEKEGNGLYRKDFLRTWDMSDEDIRLILSSAEALKNMRDRNVSSKVFDSGIAVSMFNNSRNMGMEFAFASGCDMLGLTLREMSGRIGPGSLAETAAMVSYMADVIGIRDGRYIEKSSRYMARMVSTLKESRDSGIMAQRPYVINLGSDEDSPVQTISDLEHMALRFGGLENLRGKKIAVTWAYSPDGTRPLAVPNGTISLVSRFGMDVVFAAPDGYDLMPDVCERAAANAEKSGGSFTRAGSMEEAFADADIVYPVNWAPYNFLQSRTEFCDANLERGIELLEHELKEQNAQYVDWECTESLMENTRNGAALLLHDLPAEITDISCIRGEMTAQVYNANRDALLTQAGLRPYVIAAMVMLTRSEDPKAVLESLNRKAVRRYI